MISIINTEIVILSRIDNVININKIFQADNGKGFVALDSRNSFISVNVVRTVEVVGKPPGLVAW